MDFKTVATKNRRDLVGSHGKSQKAATTFGDLKML
jgi:hypothetical protein